MSDDEGIVHVEAQWWESQEVFATQEDFHHELELLSAEEPWDSAAVLFFWFKDGHGGMLSAHVFEHPSLWLEEAFEAVVKNMPEKVPFFQGVGFTCEGYMTIVDENMEVVKDTVVRQECKLVSTIVGERFTLSTCGRNLEWKTEDEGVPDEGRVTRELIKISERLKEMQSNGK